MCMRRPNKNSECVNITPALFTSVRLGLVILAGQNYILSDDASPDRHTTDPNFSVRN